MWVNQKIAEVFETAAVDGKPEKQSFLRLKSLQLTQLKLK